MSIANLKQHRTNKIFYGTYLSTGSQCLTFPAKLSGQGLCPSAGTASPWAGTPECSCSQNRARNAPPHQVQVTEVPPFVPITAEMPSRGCRRRSRSWLSLVLHKQRACQEFLNILLAVSTHVDYDHWKLTLCFWVEMLGHVSAPVLGWDSERWAGRRETWAWKRRKNRKGAKSASIPAFILHIWTGLRYSMYVEKRVIHDREMWDTACKCYFQMQCISCSYVCMWKMFHIRNCEFFFLRWVMNQ